MLAEKRKMDKPIESATTPILIRIETIKLKSSLWNPQNKGGSFLLSIFPLGSGNHQNLLVPNACHKHLPDFHGQIDRQANSHFQKAIRHTSDRFIRTTQKLQNRYLLMRIALSGSKKRPPLKIERGRGHFALDSRRSSIRVRFPLASKYAMIISYFFIAIHFLFSPVCCFCRTVVQGSPAPTANLCFQYKSIPLQGKIRPLIVPGPSNSFCGSQASLLRHLQISTNFQIF